MAKLIKFYGHQYCFNVFHKLLKYYEMIIMKKKLGAYIQLCSTFLILNKPVVKKYFIYGTFNCYNSEMLVIMFICEARAISHEREIVCKEARK